MKKFFLTVLLVLLSVLIVVGCSSPTGNENENEESQAGEAPEGNSENQNSAEKEKKTINISVLGSPQNTTTQVLYTFKEELESLADGQIEVVIHHSGSLYGQDADERAVLRGNLEMTYVDAASVAAHLPEASMYNAAYMWKNYEHMNAALSGEIGQEFFEKVASEVGYRPLAAFYHGDRQLNYRDVGREIRTPEDVQGLVLRMPNNRAMIFIGEAMGASVTPLAFGEVYTGLSTGTIDAQDNSMEVTIDHKFYEVTDYVSLTNHVVDSLFPIINEDFFQSLGSELQEMVYKAIEITKEENDNIMLSKREDAIEVLESKGVTVISDVDIEAFMSEIQEKYLNDDISAEWNMDVFNQIQELADQF